MIAIIVFFAALVVLIAVVATEDARLPGSASSIWKITGLLVAAAGFAVFAFGLVTLIIIIGSTQARGPEGQFPAFLAATVCSVTGAALFSLTVLPSRSVFGRRAAFLARMTLSAALTVAALFAWQQISWHAH
jgi:hypothetical protein